MALKIGKIRTSTGREYRTGTGFALSVPSAPKASPRLVLGGVEVEITRDAAAKSLIEMRTMSKGGLPPAKVVALRDKLLLIERAVYGAFPSSWLEVGDPRKAHPACAVAAIFRQVMRDELASAYLGVSVATLNNRAGRAASLLLSMPQFEAYFSATLETLKSELPGIFDGNGAISPFSLDEEAFSVLHCAAPRNPRIPKVKSAMILRKYRKQIPLTVEVSVKLRRRKEVKEKHTFAFPLDDQNFSDLARLVRVAFRDIADAPKGKLAPISQP